MNALNNAPLLHRRSVGPVTSIIIMTPIIPINTFFKNYSHIYDVEVAQHAANREVKECFKARGNYAQSSFFDSRSFAIKRRAYSECRFEG